MPSPAPVVPRVSRSAAALRRVALSAASAGIPLPRTTDWRPADGWLPAGVLACQSGVLAAVWLAWARVAPHTAPHASRLLPAAALLALAELALAAAFAWRPLEHSTGWRSLTIALAVAGGVWADPAGLHARLAFPCLLSAGLLGLGMRLAETLGAALARPLHQIAVGNPFGGRPAVEWVPGRPTPESDDSPVRAAWRVVAECWVVAALAGAAGGGASPAWRAVLATAALGGCILVVGTAVSTLRASWDARGFTHDAAQIPAFWGLGLAVAAAVVGIAAAVPMPRGPLSPEAVRRFERFLSGLRLPATAARGLGGHNTFTPPPAATAAALPGLLLGALRAAFWSVMGTWLAFPVAIPIILALAVGGAYLWARLTRHRGLPWDVPRGLAAILRALLGFWRWLRWPRRLRAALQRLGWLRPTEAPGPAPSGAATWFERAWARVDPRQAVRLTYRRFLREAAASGVARRAHESPRAFERAVTGRGVAGEDVARLTEVYEEARFSDHAAERGWVARARRGLAALRGERRARAARGRPVARRALEPGRPHRR